MKAISAVLVTLGLTATLISCGNSVKNESKNETERSSIYDEAPSGILGNYLIIKDALVQTNAQAASMAAERLVISINDDQSELMKNILIDSKQIAESKDVENQRDHFKGLSENIYKWIKETEVNDQKLYKQYCPMAFNYEGAYWLSAEKEVNNPYFGNKMLHCGTVKEEL